MFFKDKTNNSVQLYNPVDGQIILIEEVNDPVFSQKMMGDGFAVKPSNTNLFSPVKGKIVSIFPTKHAIGIRTKEGIEVLVHMGINTVELNGKGFEIFVQKEEIVTEETMLAMIDLEFLKKEGFDTDIIVISTNLEDKKVVLKKNGIVAHGDLVGKISI